MLGTQGVGCPYLLAAQPLLRRLLQESKHEVQELLAQVRPLRQARPQAPLSACAGGTAPAKYFLNFFGDLKRGSPPQPGVWAKWVPPKFTTKNGSA